VGRTGEEAVVAYFALGHR